MVVFMVVALTGLLRSVEKVGLGGGLTFLQPEDIWGKEFSVFFTSQKLHLGYLHLCGNISIGYWDGRREISTRKLSWKGMNLGIEVIRYSREEWLYWGWGIIFHHTWMEAEHLPIGHIKKSVGSGISVPFLIGAEFPITDNFWGGVEHVFYIPFPWHIPWIKEDRVSRQILPMGYLRANIKKLL